ncbi:MAG: 2-succinyl-5-enolpyruvyl-6-hydroxy-3-cyclohexene-1-carboxylic-acid synthase [Chloroflexota bacterium]|nr:2-succinyl-5-enolpyruvyl-6-hydroxy-3-cyclohexene-1-carboxylic-acid synthase [Chloroflexota bacterium]
MIYAPNRNYVWTYTFVEALAQAGLRHVVIAPGSRSTPLTMAFAQHPHIRVYSHIDERGAAFMALGLALAEDAPAAVVCSSGTAAANFFPAIVEAHYAHVPLLVLTADRPHELRDSGANQTVDQVKLYGDHVLWSVDMALPEANPPDVALRNLRSLAARAVALANGMPKGTVHLNFPFRKPLEPTEVAGEGREVAWGLGLNRQDAKDAKKNLIQEGREEEARGSGGQGVDVGTRHASSAVVTEPTSSTATTSGVRTPFMASNLSIPRIERGVMMPTAEQMERLKEILRPAERVLIVCGPRTPRGAFGEAVNDLSVGKVVFFADAQSSLRDVSLTNVIGTYELFLPLARQYPHPQVVMHFGAMPTSQPLLDYLNMIEPIHRIVISENGVWTDFDHQIDLFIQADPTEICRQLRDGDRWVGNDYHRDRDWYDLFARADVASTHALHNAMNEAAWFDGQAASEAAKGLGAGNLFVANSLPIRHIEQFTPYLHPKTIRLYCNRGASGIDGTISSAIGVAAAEPDKPTVLIIGDLAFYHDMNALLAAKRNGIHNLVIVLLNNNGGQIFRRLPINKPEFEPYFTELFTTPHGMTFEHTAAQFSFAYARADDREAFKAAFTAALASGQPSIVEVVTDAEEDAKRRKALMDKIAEAIKVATAGERE